MFCIIHSDVLIKNKKLQILSFPRKGDCWSQDDELMMTTSTYKDYNYGHRNRWQDQSQLLSDVFHVILNF